MSSALYVGEVTHRRLKVVRHALRYRVFMLLLDLDEPVKRRLLPFGLMRFDPRDHGDGTATPLCEQVRTRLAEAGIEAGGPVRLLCMPRVLGYGFNPLSVYFCHRADGRLAAILYEVTNTFGDRHSYLIPADAGEGEAVAQTAQKRLHVSPFMDMGLTYRFTVHPPGETLQVAIGVEGPEGPVLGTAFVGKRRPFTDGQLLRAWLTHPLLTWKVTGGIHWEALKLWLKGAGYRRRPAPPAEAVSLGSKAEPRRSILARMKDGVHA